MSQSEKPFLTTVNQNIRSQALAVRNLAQLFFALFILSSTNDKLAIPVVGIKNPITLYKVLFILLLVLYAVDTASHPIVKSALFDRGLYRVLVASIIFQTIASLLGGWITFGEISLGPEIYGLIQISTFLFIPMVARRYNISPQSVLKLFLGAILLHYLFIASQFLAPQAYASFVQFLYSPLRGDNALGWNDHDLSFIGLQRTANYGTFTAAFGLLILAFTSKSPLGKLLALSVGSLSIFFWLFSYSRAVFLMMMVALLVIGMRAKIVFKGSTNLGILVIPLTLAGALLAIAFDTSLVRWIEDVPSLYAFVAPEKGGIEGKLQIAESAPYMFYQSPIVGWGHRNFADIQTTAGIPVLSPATHSYALTILLSCGIIGGVVYVAMFIGIVRALWRCKRRDYVIVCAMFIGLGLYNVVYDAGSLDVFACFNGIAAYYALRSKSRMATVRVGRRFKRLNTELLKHVYTVSA